MNRTAAVGFIVWSATFVYLHPAPSHLEWAQLLLLLAASVLVPLGLKLVDFPAQSPLERFCKHALRLALLPCALALSVALRLPTGIQAALLASCWFVVTLIVAILGALRLKFHARWTVAKLCIAMGMIYLSVGGGWAVLSRAGIRPLDFEPTIVLLTAIHFHYAGFLLPLLAGLAIRARSDFVARLAGIGVVAGVPFVAIGITATRLGVTPWLECAAAWITSAAGLLMAYLYGRLSCQTAIGQLARALWFVCALSLAFGMVLAAAYGSRFYLPLAWLDIPWMRALHGTANALGFAACGVAGWIVANRDSVQKRPI